MDQYTVQWAVPSKQNKQKRQTNKQNTQNHNKTKPKTKKHREVGSLPALRKEMHDDILCVIMSMATPSYTGGGSDNPPSVTNTTPTATTNTTTTTTTYYPAAIATQNMDRRWIMIFQSIPLLINSINLKRDGVRTQSQL